MAAKYRLINPAAAWSKMRLSFFWKAMVALMALLVVLAIIIAPMANAFNQRAQDAEIYSEQFGSKTEGALFVDIKMTSVDYAAATYKVHVAVGPYPDLPASTLFDDNDFPKMSFDLFFSENTNVFTAGRPAAPFDATLNFATGDSSYYPFDTWTDQLYIDAWTTTNSTPVFLPLYVQFIGNMPITAVHSNWGNSTTTFVMIMLEVQRSITTKVFSVFIIILMWLLSLATAGVAYEIVVGGREVVPPNMAAAAALLFAIVNVRNAQPGVPPVGILIDICGYFWNVALIAISSFLIMSMWVYRWTPKEVVAEVKKPVVVPPASKDTLIEIKP